MKTDRGQATSDKSSPLAAHTINRRHALLLGAALPSLAACATTSVPDSFAANLALRGPVTGGAKGWTYRSPAVNLEQKGYMMEEYFIGGIANAFQLKQGAHQRFDGAWDTEPSEPANYLTRIYIVRPIKKNDFNGVLLAHWQNVTAGYENGCPAGDEVFKGYAWMGVSAQKISIEGTPSTERFALPDWDPERYGALHHPGDAYSYEIFEQCVRTALTAGPSGPFGPLRPDTIVAVGASQSAMRLASYINAAHQHHALFDAFLLSVHWGITPPLEEIGLLQQFDVAGVGKNISWGQINDRGDVPIMVVNSQAEALTNYPARQPDTDTFRFWEISGAPHGSPRRSDETRLSSRRDGMESEPDPARNIVEWDYIADAALRALVRWQRTGEQPPRFNPIEIRKTPDGPAFVLDDSGNVQAGIRPPEVAVAVGVHTAGLPASELDGRTRLFDEEKMQALHGSREAFFTNWNRAIDDLLKAGLILPNEANYRRGRAGVFWKGKPTHAPAAD
jgi:hypothetical protein